GVAELGGLRIIGIEHQTNARKDDQIRGRAGRQGLPGSTQFYVCPGDAALSHLPARTIRGLAKAIESDRLEQPSGHLRRMFEHCVTDAQQRAETNARAQRKLTTDFDSIIQRQRKTVIERRRALLRDDDLRMLLRDWIREAANEAIEAKAAHPSM